MWATDYRNPGSYASVMSTSPLSPDDIRAAAEAHAELGPEYRDAVVESFLAKIDNEIGARIDARLAAAPRTQRRDPDPVAAARRRGLATGLAGGLTLGTIITGVPLTEAAIHIGNIGGWSAWHVLWFIWAAIAVLYGAGAAAILFWNRRNAQSTEGRKRIATRQIHPGASS